MTTSLTFDARKVVAAAVSTFVALFMAVSMMPASASTSAYIPSEWASDPNYFLGYRHSGYTGSNFANAVHAADNPWDNLSGNWLDFNWGGTNNSVFTWQDPCLSPTGGVYVGTAALSSLATEKTCTNSGTINRSNIAVDRTFRDWEFGPANASAGEWDLRGVLVHEFGHAAGFVGHFAGSWLCPDTSADHTMCPTLFTAENHWRTLESNDIQQIEMAY